MTTKFLSALALVAAASTMAVAQTDFGSPIGAGAGLGGSVVPLGVPGSSAGARGLSGAGAAGLANARAAYQNAGSGGVNVPNPAGGTVNLPQAAAQALAGVLGGNPTPAQSQALTAALSPVPAGESDELARALRALGGSPTFGNLTSAVTAFNAAIDALPAGENPPPALLAARQALAAAAR